MTNQSLSRPEICNTKSPARKKLSEKTGNAIK